MASPEQDRYGPTSPPDDHIVVGKIVGPWGITGDLKVEALTDSPERLSLDSTVHLNGRPARIMSSRVAKNLVILKLDTVPDRNMAETLSGTLLSVPQTEVPPLPKGTFYHHQIIGMDVWSDEGESLGKVTEIISTGGNDVYVVRDTAGADLLIPAISDVVLSIDTEHSKMTVRLIEGLR